MRISLPAIALLLAAPCFALTPRHTPTNSHASVRHTALKSHHASLRQSPMGMDSDRAAQIQTALIKAGYLSGQPTGSWDASSVAAMQKLQGDNGWQTRITPDSRALIKLGLGPQPSQQ
jgi:peptidoglycan hydrolase-like protein with peptidoglycan-binding domain